LLNRIEVPLPALLHSFNLWIVVRAAGGALIGDALDDPEPGASP